MKSFGFFSCPLNRFVGVIDREQFADGDKFISFREEGVERRRNGGYGGFPQIVGEDDFSWPDLAEDSSTEDSGRWLCSPWGGITWVYAPVHIDIAEGLIDPSRLLFSQQASRGADSFGGDPGGLEYGFVGEPNFLFNDAVWNLVGGIPEEPGVRHRVIANFVAFRDHSFQDLGIAERVFADDVESAPQITLLQGVEDLIGPGTRAVIEREGDYLLLSGHAVIAVLGRHLPRRWKTLQRGLAPISVLRPLPWQMFPNGTLPE